MPKQGAIYNWPDVDKIRLKAQWTPEGYLRVERRDRTGLRCIWEFEHDSGNKWKCRRCDYVWKKDHGSTPDPSFIPQDVVLKAKELLFQTSEFIPKVSM
jgi:hypothetical protein